MDATVKPDGFCSENGEWSTDRKIVIGYNDLTEETFWDEAIVSPGKSFELTCSLNKVGNVESELDIDLITDNDHAVEKINTEFKITTLWQNVSLNTPEIFFSKALF